MIVAREKYKDTYIVYIDNDIHKNYIYMCSHNIGELNVADANKFEDRGAIVFVNTHFIPFAVYANTRLGYVLRFQSKWGEVGDLTKLEVVTGEVRIFLPA